MEAYATEILAIGLYFAVLVYLVPSMIAVARFHNNWLAIFVVNLIFGWTILGWAGALVWACMESRIATVTERERAEFSARMIDLPHAINLIVSILVSLFLAYRVVSIHKSVYGYIILIYSTLAIFAFCRQLARVEVVRLTKWVQFEDAAPFSCWLPHYLYKLCDEMDRRFDAYKTMTLPSIEWIMSDMNEIEPFLEYYKSQSGRWPGLLNRLNQCDRRLLELGVEVRNEEQKRGWRSD